MLRLHNIRIKETYILVAEREVPYPYVVIMPRDEITEKTIKFLLGVSIHDKKFILENKDYEVNFNTELFLLLRNVYATL